MVHDVPEIVELVGTTDADLILAFSDQDAQEKVKSVLRSIFTKIMTASKENIVEVTARLKDRLHFESQVCLWSKFFYLLNCIAMSWNVNF